jgi:hypothetical protein
MNYNVCLNIRQYCLMAKLRFLEKKACILHSTKWCSHVQPIPFYMHNILLTKLLYPSDLLSQRFIWASTSFSISAGNMTRVSRIPSKRRTTPMMKVVRKQTLAFVTIAIVLEANLELGGHVPRGGAANNWGTGENQMACSQMMMTK